MLNSSNPKDREIMHKYGRANDMLLLQEFFPEVCPFKELVVCQSGQDYMANLQDFKFNSRRPDTPIGDEIINRTWYNNQNTVDILQDIQQENRDAVITMFKLNTPPSDHHEKDGGISISVDVGKSVGIELLGKGFSGQLLTKGRAVHERYSLVWNDLYAIGDIEKYRTYIISDEDYQKSVALWEQVLQKVGITPEQCAPHIPPTYQGVSPQAMSDAVRVLRKLPSLQNQFLARGLKSFIIQGNIEQGRFSPWQLAADTRFKKKQKAITPTGNLRTWQKLYTSE